MSTVHDTTKKCEQKGLVKNAKENKRRVKTPITAHHRNNAQMQALTGQWVKTLESVLQLIGRALIHTDTQRCKNMPGVPSGKWAATGDDMANQ